MNTAIRTIARTGDNPITIPERIDHLVFLCSLVGLFRCRLRVVYNTRVAELAMRYSDRCGLVNELLVGSLSTK